MCESHSGAKPSHKQEPAVSPVTTPGGRHTVLMQRASNASPVRVRPWQPGDEASLDDLCDGPLNTVWQSQFHQLHGPDEQDAHWRRCRIAVDVTGTVIGAATVIVNPVHAGRMPCAVEVAPAWRRRGIGSLLLEQMRRLRPVASRPLSTKLRHADPVAHAFVDRAGGRVYQRCPGITLDCADPRIHDWAAHQSTAGCTTLEGVPDDTLLAAMTDLYTWTHQDWSPVTDTDELQRSCRSELIECDRALSAAVWAHSQLAAVAFAFPATDGVEVVCETTTPAPSHGQHLVAAVLATIIRTSTRRGDGHLHLDGHRDDPHLQPVLNDLPHARDQPIDLIEIP